LPGPIAVLGVRVSIPWWVFFPLFGSLSFLTSVSPTGNIVRKTPLPSLSARFRSTLSAMGKIRSPLQKVPPPYSNTFSETASLFMPPPPAQGHKSTPSRRRGCPPRPIWAGLRYFCRSPLDVFPSTHEASLNFPLQVLWSPSLSPVTGPSPHERKLVELSPFPPLSATAIRLMVNSCIFLSPEYDRIFSSIYKSSTMKRLSPFPHSSGAQAFPSVLLSPILPGTKLPLSSFGRNMTPLVLLRSPPPLSRPTAPLHEQNTHSSLLSSSRPLRVRQSYFFWSRLLQGFLPQNYR